MKKEDLVALGLTEEQADKVAALYAGYIPKARFDEVNEAKKKALDDVKERDKQLDALKASAGDNESLKKQIEELQASNKAQAEAHKAELMQLKIDAAVDKALTENGAKSLKAARALLELGDAKLGEDGAVVGLAEQITKLKGAEETSFLFASDTAQPPTLKGFQPGASTVVPNAARAAFETRLADARKNGNQLEAIKIKQEAAAEGVALV